jgi:exodeoxyribonuclease-3
MRIITLNVNGIRSAHRKGFFDWMLNQEADLVCLQEIKAKPDELSPAITSPAGYLGYFHSADTSGYAGVALYTRKPPDQVISGLGWPDFDREGRFLRADFGSLSVVSIYLPSGSSSEERQRAKFAFMERFLPVLASMGRDGREYILCGDWNIAHKPIDLKNWRSNQKNSGFLPEERAWLDRVFGPLGFVDVFRVVNPEPEHYTWWSNRGQAWAKNVGWRIDYQVATPALMNRVVRVAIYKDQRFSDHAPLIIDYALEPPFVTT